MSLHRLAVAFFVGALGLVASAAQDAREPSFSVQVARFMASVQREWVNDYAPFILDSADKSKQNALAIGPAFAECAAIPQETTGIPVMWICISKPLSAAAASDRLREATAAIDAALPSTVRKTVEATRSTWSFDDRRISAAVTVKGDMRSLSLASVSYQHLASSPLASGVAGLMKNGLAALPGGLSKIRGAVDETGYAAVKTDFGPALPWCRLSARGAPELECFTPAYVDSFDAVFDVAAKAISAALPPAFGAPRCDNLALRRCLWSGPRNERVSLLYGLIPANTDTNGVRIIIDSAR